MRLNKTDIAIMDAIDADKIASSNRDVANSNFAVAKQMKEQNYIAKKELETKDRVDISKKEYFELLEAKKQRDKYEYFIKQVINRSYKEEGKQLVKYIANHSYELTVKIGKIEDPAQLSTHFMVDIGVPNHWRVQ